MVSLIVTKDPKAHNDATLIKHTDFDSVLKQELKVMDLAAFCQCRDYSLPIRVFNINVPGHIEAVVKDPELGSTISLSEN